MLRRHILPRLSGRLGRFLLVGCTGVALNSFVLYLLHQMGGLPVVVASGLAVEAAIVNNYFWNDRWTFGHARPSLRRFGQFNLVSLGGLLLTTSAVWVLTAAFGLHYLLANLAGIGLATAWNFAANVYWTWGAERRSSRAPAASQRFGPRAAPAPSTET